MLVVKGQFAYSEATSEHDDSQTNQASSAVQTAQELLEFVTFGEARCSL